ncbi:hypothetical protein U9M48_014784 [Paspalum notatum var. saurae]|uniref:Uncharacterized protein n=1 Tax=Paspalum notatum var. saurae TaxID=547442 RepID=A0AAQ3T3W5_PASNO
MDAATAMKRKGAEAPAPWLHDGVPAPATKIRRLDAEVPPVEPGAGAPLVGPSAGVPPPPPPHQAAFGVEGAPVIGDVAARGMDATALLKRKCADAPQPWLDADGVPVPATKIRRLDAAEVLPSAEYAAGVAPQPFAMEEAARVSGGVAPVVVAAPAANEERAIVVYQPAEAARSLLLGPLRPGASLRVSSDWIHGLRSTMLQEASNHRALFEQLASSDENPNLAMVPWTPAQVHAHAASGSRAAAAAEMMDADQDGDGASMEVEHGVEARPMPPAGGPLQGEPFQQEQWPMQHCVAPQQLQLPAATYQPSPITWSW